MKPSLWWIVPIILSIMLVDGLRGEPVSGTTMPEQLITRASSDAGSRIILETIGPSDFFGCIRLCWFAQPHPSALVLYTPGSANTSPPANDRYEVLIAGESGGTWHELTRVSGEGSGNGTRTGPPALADYFAIPLSRMSITNRYGVRRSYLLVMGRTSSADVATVEFHLDGGDVTRVVPTQGYFAALAPAHILCEVRFEDAQGNVLQQLGPAEDPLLAMYRRQQPDAACPG